ncbi:PEP-CTERM sorting domain-containing protein [Stenomitos frigidus]|uniref:PEP-CTERM sorting domain-containing protein n=1 Tax=Stenomitos frigidus ULC18 TaxID=2107698 RepID=A0A2T1EPT7_9CYAN|nr:PEP-CTERM sorting domain-containing protein [Stenomitos frigidus]PSB34678.1 PEP-CTERM sorting domain-containing protein [Stenomitos frigidus ULC18]
MKIRLHAPVFLSLFTLIGFAAAKADAALLIGNSESNTIIIFDESTGTFQGNFVTPGLGGLRAPDDLTIGPDGNVYVSSGGNSGLNLFDPTYPQDSAVLRFSPIGEFLGVAASGSGLIRPYGNAFGPDGSLFVSSFRTNEILRYDGTTGAFLGVFASDHNGGFGTLNGLNGPNGLLFAPDGSLYVTTEGTANDVKGDLAFAYASQVLRYTPEQVAGLASTATPSVFIDQPDLLPETPGFISLLGLALAPSEDSLYVSDFAGGIRQYDLADSLLSVISTNYTGTIPSSNFVGSLTFGSGDNSENLYAIGFDTTNKNIGSVLAYADAEGSAATFSGALFTNSSLERPIGVVATNAAGVPEPSTVAGLLLGLGGLGVARLRQRRSPIKP